MNKRLTSWLSTSNWQSLGHGRHAPNKEIGFINIKAGISTMKHFEIITKSVSRALIILLMFGFAFCSNAAVESITYITTDHLGSPIMATDHSGAVKWRQDYLPYGAQLIKQDGDNSVGFTGHVDEKSLNVTYMQGRWYHPEVGRFLAIDPVGFVEGNPMSFNRYAYANNNPYKYIDPDGRQSREATLAALEIDDPSAKGRNIASFLKENFYAGSKWVDDVVSTWDFWLEGPGLKAASGVLGLTKVAKSAGKADSAPDFVVSPGGTAFPVPKGATGPTSVVNPAGKKTGDAFTGGSGGANGQVDTMRMMDATPPRGNSPGYPNGYIKYENKAGQGVDPYTGRTLSNKDSHFPID